MDSPARPTGSIWSRPYMKAQIDKALLTPVRAFKPAYIPLLMIYFASGALGITAIAREFWIRQSLTLSVSDLAALGVWLTLPWTIKMVIGELVDTTAIAGSRRRAYVYIGAGLIAAGLLILSLSAAGRLPQLTPDDAYRAAMLITVIGVVVQDVVADTMTIEVVARQHPDGTPRERADIDCELGMVQVLGRLAVAIGAFIVAGLGGLLASQLPYWLVFALGLVVPAISATGAALVAIAPVSRRAIDWRILGGGIAFGGFALAMGLSGWRFNQEAVLIVSMGVLCWMLVRVTRDIEPETKRVILYAAIIIFVFRATPFLGEGYNWFTMDVLGFDELFKGWLAQIGTAVALAAMWLFADAITRQPVARVLLWLTIATTMLSLPSFGLTLGLHEWTERQLGIGARSIAIVDAAVMSPLIDLSAIPMLTLCAIYAPPAHRATWFALMASLMNLALVAANLQTKYLNDMLPVPRGEYGNLSAQYAVVLLIGLVVPLVTITVLGRRLR
jgi:hypothetical protein